MTTTTPTTPDTAGTTAPPALLRVAVPNKGSLSETAGQMLAEAGYTGRRDPKELHVVDLHSGEVVNSGVLPVVPNEIGGTLG